MRDWSRSDKIDEMMRERVRNVSDEQRCVTKVENNDATEFEASTMWKDITTEVEQDNTVEVERTTSTKVERKNPTEFEIAEFLGWLWVSDK